MEVEFHRGRRGRGLHLLKEDARPPPSKKRGLLLKYDDFEDSCGYDPVSGSEVSGYSSGGQPLHRSRSMPHVAELPSESEPASPPPPAVTSKIGSKSHHSNVKGILNHLKMFPLSQHDSSSSRSHADGDSGLASASVASAASGASIPGVGGVGGYLKEDEANSESQQSSQYCPSLLLGDLGLMLGGQIVLPEVGSGGKSKASSSGGSKVQGDFASGGSHMLASEPQSSAHSEDQVQAGNVAAVKQLVLNQIDKKLKDLRTLKQHYYPEGGWGWVVLLVAATVQAVVVGAQLAVGAHLCGGSEGGVGVAAGPGVGVAVVRGGVTSYSLRAAVLHGRRLVAGNEEETSWLGALSLSLSLFISPLTVAVCRRKSTRLTAVMGGLVTALGCLFTSFASQFHQLFLSYGIMMGIGVGMTRDPATLMLGQYFKRKRDKVEVVLVASSGIGLAVMSVFIQVSMGKIGWRLGLQAITGIVFLTFFLGTFYRSASLYHPQRRAILHLKSQKRKIKSKDKEKNKAQDDRPPYFDFATLRSRTVRILLSSIAIASVGLFSPIFYLVQQAHSEGIYGNSILLLQAYLGLAWAVGCGLFGAIVVNHSKECQISKQYLCQASLLLVGVSIMGFTAVEGYNGYLIFVWIYGIFCGGYNYTLKMYVYEKVRARNFARAWGFAQFSMSIPALFGIPTVGYITTSVGDKRGFYFSAIFVILGSLAMTLIDVHRNKLRKHKEEKRHRRALSHKSVGGSSIGAPNTTHSNVDGAAAAAMAVAVEAGGGASLGPMDVQADGMSSPSSHHTRSNASGAADVFERKLSFTDQDDMMPPVALLSHQRSFTYDDIIDMKNKPELTIFSEEGIADMDLPDHLFMEELEYLDNITSCNKVENCVMLSEFEQNLIKETESPTHGARSRRKWSLFRQPSTLHSEASPELNATIGIGGLRQSSFSHDRHHHHHHRKASKGAEKRKEEGEEEENQADASKEGEKAEEGSNGEAAISRPRELPVFPNTAAWNSRLRMPSKSGPKRSITVIEEASV